MTSILAGYLWGLLGDGGDDDDPGLLYYIMLTAIWVGIIFLVAVGLVFKGTGADIVKTIGKVLETYVNGLFALAKAVVGPLLGLVGVKV